MKKSILISILTLMIFLNLKSEVNLTSDYQEYNDNHQLNYQFKYIKNLSNFNIQFENSLQKSNNKIFDQINSINQFNTTISSSYGKINHGLLMTYKRKFDHYPQYQVAGDVSEDQYLTGYYLDLPVTDSLTTSAKIRFALSKEDNPNLVNNNLTNRGYLANVTSNYGFKVWQNNFHLDLTYNHDNRTRNYNNQFNMVMTHNLDNEFIYMYNQVYYQASQDDIFTLKNNSYKQESTQKRDNFRIVNQISNNYGDRLSGLFENIFTKNNNRLDESNNRTSKDDSYDLNLNLTYQVLDKMSLIMENHYNESRKYLSQKSNNRESDTKKIKLGIIIDNVFFDSLSVTQSMEKTSTNFPNAENGFDNDYVSEITWLNARKLFAETVNFNNQFSYSKTQDVYINSSFSASNNIKTSYSYQPDIDILLGDNLLISQLYSLRINYDDYIYDSISNSDATLTLYDRFYRQVSAEFKIRYDNSPVRRRLNRSIWKKPKNLLLLRDNINLVFSYKYFANETGDRKSKIYETTGESQKHDAYVKATKSYGPLSFSVKPKASWGNTQIYEVESVFSYYQSEDTNLSISFKPRYEVDNEEFVYTVNTIVAIRF